MSIHCLFHLISRFRNIPTKGSLSRELFSRAGDESATGLGNLLWEKIAGYMENITCKWQKCKFSISWSAVRWMVLLISTKLLSFLIFNFVSEKNSLIWGTNLESGRAGLYLNSAPRWWIQSPLNITICPWGIEKLSYSSTIICHVIPALTSVWTLVAIMILVGLSLGSKPIRIEKEELSKSDVVVFNKSLSSTWKGWFKVGLVLIIRCLHHVT